MKTHEQLTKNEMILLLEKIKTVDISRRDLKPNSRYITDAGQAFNDLCQYWQDRKSGKSYDVLNATALSGTTFNSLTKLAYHTIYEAE